MNPPAKHYLAEYYGCSRAILNDYESIGKILTGAAERAGARIVKSFFHQYAPHGISGVVIIAESHLAIHTWPEYGYAAVDLFSCSALEYEKAFIFIKQGLESKKVQACSIERGSGRDMAGGLTVLELQ